MKTVDVTYLIKPLTTSTYFKPIKVWEYETFKDAVMDAIEVSKGCHEKDYGIVLVFINSYADAMVLPTHHVEYFNQFGDKIDGRFYDEDLGHGYEECILHHVPWTEDLGIEDNYRLQFIYTGHSYNQEEVDTYVNDLGNIYRDAPVSWNFLDFGKDC